MITHVVARLLLLVRFWFSISSVYLATITTFKDLRKSDVSAIDVIAILDAVHPNSLDEQTRGGQPAGWGAMHLLCQAGDHPDERVQLVKHMLELRASPSLKAHSNGATPLHRAAGGGAAKDLVEVLLEARAHVNAKNNNGSTPLDAASGTGQDEVIVV